MDNSMMVELISGIVLVFLVIIKYLHGYILEYLLEPIKRWFKRNRLDEIALTSGRVINNLLLELRVKTNADRASLFFFHNGQHFNPRILNNSIWKFTCAYEMCKDGVSYECSNMQNLLVTNHLPLIQSLWGQLDDGYTKYKCPICKIGCKAGKNIIVVVDINQISFGNTKALYTNQGTKKLIISPIIIGDDYVGFLTISYSNNFNFGELLMLNDAPQGNRGLEIICEFANKIAFRLSQK